MDKSRHGNRNAERGGQGLGRRDAGGDIGGTTDDWTGRGGSPEQADDRALNRDERQQQRAERQATHEQHREEREQNRGEREQHHAERQQRRDERQGGEASDTAPDRSPM